VNWEQLKAIFWLRWRLTRNQWGRSKHGVRGPVAIIIFIAACLLGALCFFAGLIGAALGLRNARSDEVMITWFILVSVFLMFWILGLLAELQRSEAIDLQRLMHLPVQLGQIFVVNYFASHFALSIIIAVPAIFGLSIGLALARGALMLLMLPLALGMIFMITAWTYCLRGWLAALMTNPRRRRTIIAGLTFAFVLLVQLPNLYLNVFSHSHVRGSTLPLSRILAAQKLLPPFWVSLGAKYLVEENPAPALLSTIGFLSFGALGLQRAYRSTLKFYHGETSDDASASPQSSAIPSVNHAPAQTIPTALEGKLPGISEEASAVALASFRSILRAPEIKMSWAMSLVVPLIVAATTIFRARVHLPASFKPFLIPSVITFSLFTQVQFLSNQFGFDRDGFQTFVLSPTRRSAILLGKNIAASPVIFGSGALWLILACIFVGLPLFTALAAFFQIASMALIATVFGNFISIYLPFRIRTASLRPTKISGGRGLLVVLCQLLSPLLLIPVFIAPIAEFLCHLSGITTAFPINLALSIIITLLAIVLYWWSLPSLGQQLQQREIKILEALTTEVE
jgi:ABC-2 type transport system permease protein